MKPIVLTFTALVLFSSCTDPVSPVTIAPDVYRAYDIAKGGLQITQILLVKDTAGAGYNEMLTLDYVPKGSAPFPAEVIKGWTLKPGKRQAIPLPDSMALHLTIYTHGVKDSSSMFFDYLGLSSTTFIWNKDHDTAGVFDASGKLVSELDY